MQTATDVLFCSFCGKSQTDVKKLIAGPGVYICDECVGLCVEIMDTEGTPVRTKKPPTEFPKLKELSDEELLSRMVRVAQSRDQVDGAVGRFVRLLRERGWTWARIGEALGMTRQSAWERYSEEE